MKFAGMLVWICFACCTVNVRAQDPNRQHLQELNKPLSRDSVELRGSDSTVIVSARRGNNDRMRNKVDSIIQITSSDGLFAPSYMFKPSPRKAVIYSAIFPGLGQIYNRKYWKLPIVYGGFVGLTYAITWNNGYYQDYLGAYQDIMDDNPETNSWHKMLPYGRDPETTDVKWFTDVLQQRKDYFRYYRDLSIIASVGLYLVAMVDAYVDAQLFDFDISPDLSLHVAPTIIKENQSLVKGNSFYGVHWSFCF